MILYCLPQSACGEVPTIEEAYSTVAVVSGEGITRVFFVREDGVIQAERPLCDEMTWWAEGDCFVVEWERSEHGVGQSRFQRLHRIIRFRYLVQVQIDEWPQKPGGWLNMRKNMRDLKFPEVK